VQKSIRILSHKNKEWDTQGDFIYNITDETLCLSCGKANSVLWNKEQGRCPKCDSMMNYNVNGKFKVKKLLNPKK